MTEAWRRRPTSSSNTDKDKKSVSRKPETRLKRPAPYVPRVDPRDYKERQANEDKD